MCPATRIINQYHERYSSATKYIKRVEALVHLALLKGLLLAYVYGIKNIDFHGWLLPGAFQIDVVPGGW